MMLNMKFPKFLLWCVVFVSASLLGQPYGSLVIVGGALNSSNEEVYEKFIGLAGGADKAQIAVIPAASGSPAQSAESFRKNLVRYGLSESRVYIVPVAVLDCSSTDDVDESLWFANAEDPDVASRIFSSTGIWFTGGDQSRIIKAFRRADGTNTATLQAIYDAWKKGAVIGGTSAGAAIMSEVMITGGVSMASLKYGISDTYIDSEQQDNGALTIDKGLGFFSYGIIDQHFDKKSRLGRLVVATMYHKATFPLGFGIDENTALVYYSDKNMIESIGEGGITIVDSRNAQMKKSRSYPSYSGLMVSYIEKNDSYNLLTGEFIINNAKKKTTGNEYYSIKTSTQSGIFSSYSSTYKDLISYQLIDNKVNNSVISYCYDDDPVALKVVFSKSHNTLGFWTNSLSDRDNYSFVHVGMDVFPVRVNIKTLK
jgi:cyanophycinase